MNHIVYKTTCTITGKYYIGIHSTNDLDDGYLGSGKLLRRSINKYGANSHIREIIANLKTRKDASNMEKKMVTAELIAEDKMCLNLAPGGEGGDTLSNHPNREAIYAKAARVGPANGMFGKKHTAESILKMSENRSGTESWNRGIRRTEDEKRRISEATKAAMAKPEVRAKYEESRKIAATKIIGRITIWRHGHKKIVPPEEYTEQLKSDGWVRSKAESLFLL